MNRITQMCAECGFPATGVATIGNKRYCHGDDDPEPTCYMRAQWRTSLGRAYDRGETPPP